MTLDKIVSTIKEAKKIAILPHINADGDALGSGIALTIALKKMNKEVILFLEEEIPRVYSFLPCDDKIRVYKGEVQNFDIAIALDTGDLERLGERSEIFNSAKITVNIDHHTTNSSFAFYNYIDKSSSATGEIVYQLLKIMGLDIDKDMATCLYVALSTDTGGFRYSNTTSLTHQITADLINQGVSIADISQKVFENTSIQKVKLTGIAINSLEIFENNKVAFITITDNDIKNAGAKDEDCEGIVNIGRNIESIEVAAMFRHKSNSEIKVNLRSKSYADVASIAGLYGGGGHKRAAGCTVGNKRIEDVKAMLLKDIHEELIKLREF
jgi:bifunctional oligoribonuclease and PAP phosphatase NrnA